MRYLGERHSSDKLARRGMSEPRDPTRFSLDVQFEALNQSVRKVQRSLDAAVKAKNEQKINQMSGLLSNQLNLLYDIARRISALSMSEPIAVPGSRVLMDLTVDLSRYAPTRPRFSQEYVNNGREYRPKRFDTSRMV